MAFVNHLVRLEVRLYYQAVNITAYEINTLQYCQKII